MRLLKKNKVVFGKKAPHKRLFICLPADGRCKQGLGVPRHSTVVTNKGSSHTGKNRIMTRGLRSRRRRIEDWR